MKRSRFMQEQIIGVFKEHQAGASAPDLCRKHGIREAKFYTWRSKYGGMEVSEGPVVDVVGSSGGVVSGLFATSHNRR